VVVRDRHLPRWRDQSGRLVRLLPNYEPVSRSLHTFYAPDRRITPKLRLFIDFAITRFGSGTTWGQT